MNCRTFATFTVSLLAVTALTATLAPTTAQTEGGVQKGQILSSGSPDKTDLRPINKGINDWRDAEHQRLRKEGRATSEEFRKIDEEAITRARAAEAHRTRALDDLSSASGVKVEQGKFGKSPLEGRGSLGDIDTDSLDPRHFDSVMETAKSKGYTVKQKGDAFTIVEIDTTVHRKSVGEMTYGKKSGSIEQVGSSGYSAEIGRGGNPETALGIGRSDPAIAVTDNLKKAAHIIDKPAGDLTPEDLQKLAKMTQRNLAAIDEIGASGKAVASTDPLTKSQADKLKNGYSPEAAGIVRDHATPEERIADIADFQRRAKQTAVDAVKAGDAHIVGEIDRLAGEVRHAEDVLHATEATGDTYRIAKAKAAHEQANKDLLGYVDLRDTAHKAVLVNEPGSEKIFGEARGVPTEGVPPSRVREEIVAGDRKLLGQTLSEPAKPPLPGEPVKPTALPEAAEGGGLLGKFGSGILKGAGAVLGAVMIYEGVKRGAEEAGKEAGEQGDGAIKSTAKTIGYSVWHGLGLSGIYEGVVKGAERAGEEAAGHDESTIKSIAKTTGYSAWYGLGGQAAADALGKAGAESMERYKKDIAEGKVDPTSFGSFAWSQVRAVGWGVSEFTGLQAVKDAATDYISGTSKDAGAGDPAKAQNTAAATPSVATSGRPPTTPISGETTTANPNAPTSPVATVAPAPGPQGTSSRPTVGPPQTQATTPATPSAASGVTGTSGMPIAGTQGRPPVDPPQTQAAAPSTLSGLPSPGTQGTSGRPPVGPPQTQATTPATQGTSATPPKPTAPLPTALPSKQQGTLPGMSSGSPTGLPTPQPGLPGALPSRDTGTLPGSSPQSVAGLPKASSGSDPTQGSAAGVRPGTSEVDGGWLDNKEGRSKVIYVVDANGDRVGGYVIHYDKNGNEIGRVGWDEKPAPPPEPGAAAEGHYGGTVTFHARPAKEVSGTLILDIRSGVVRGVLSARYQKPWPGTVQAEITGTISGDARVTATIKGTSRHQGAAEAGMRTGFTDYPFLGADRFSGQLVDGGARGTFAADGQRHNSTSVLGRPMVRCADAAKECAGWVSGSWTVQRR